MGKAWTEENVKQVLEEVENRLLSIRTTTKEYDMTGYLELKLK